MWSKPVKRLPEEISKRKEYMPVRMFLEEVMTHSAKVEQIFWYDDYMSVSSARNSIARCARGQGYPISLHVRGNLLYLVRRDI